MSTPTLEQPLRALERANAVRSAISELRVEVTGGTLGFAQALNDSRAASMYVYALLMAVRGVGRATARRVMFRAGIGELKRVRDLTERQRGVLVDKLGEFAEVNDDHLF